MFYTFLNLYIGQLYVFEILKNSNENIVTGNDAKRGAIQISLIGIINSKVLSLP